ncbi:hypothetical protein [Streptomyces sp. NPDC054765]
MNLELSAERTAVRQLAEGFAACEVTPYATAGDRAEQADRGVVKKLPRAVWASLPRDARVMPLCEGTARYGS